MGANDDRISTEALDWFLRNRAARVGAEERRAFATWLRLSVVHVEEYIKVAVVSRDLMKAFGTLDFDIDGLLRDAQADLDSSVVPFQAAVLPKRAASSSGIRAFAAAGIAAAICAPLALAWMQRDGQRFGLAKAFTTERGEQRSWLLPDGTIVDLNSNSSIVVQFNSNERLVRLARGQALFHVVHENGRRFRVVAGETGIVAVGTEFDVWRKSSSTVITVVEGTVAVFAGNVPPATAPGGFAEGALAVASGQQLQVADHVMTPTPAKVNVQLAESWVQHRIAFDQQPLGEVADRFNQNSLVPIVIQSERLRAIRITGVFSGYDTESFVAFLARLEGVEISSEGDRVLVIDKETATPTRDSR